MTLRNVEFDFKITEGSNYSRYSKGRKAVIAAINDMNLEDDDCLTRINEVMDDFFCDLLGEDYDQKLDINPDDFDDLFDLFCDFENNAIPERLKKRVASVQAAKPVQSPAAIQPVASSIPVPAPAAIPMPMNRAQRRAARRNKAKHA